MMRPRLQALLVCGALCVALSGCSETGGAGGQAGSGGSGGSAGSGGTDWCSLVTCNDGSECTQDSCDPADPYLCVFINEPMNSPCASDGNGVCDGKGTCLSCAFEDCTEARYDPMAPGSCIAVNADEGSACRGEDGACDGAGNCEHCDDGNDCTSNGYDAELQACVFPNRPEASPCECNIRGICKTCDGGGNCLCSGDEQCRAECTTDIACVQATGSCEGGEAAPKDSPCRSSWVCDGEGTCVECNADEHCDQEADFNDCTGEATCDLGTRSCKPWPPVADGTPCAGGACSGGHCVLDDSLLPCSEQGVRNAIAAGGGPYTFDCDGPTTIVTSAEIAIDNDVVLDAEGALTLEASRDQPVVMVAEKKRVELRNVGVTRGAGIVNYGVLALTNVTVSESSSWGVLNDGLLTLTNVTVSMSGGTGVFNTVVGKLTMVSSTVSENVGPGIENLYWLTIRNSTISGNRGHGIGNHMGPLVLANSTVSSNGGSGVHCEGRFTIVNSTISGNSLDGISSHGMATTNYLHNSTVSSNQQRGFVVSGGLATIANSIIEGDCLGGNIAISDGHNVESPGDSCGFDQDTDQPNVSADALDLEPLQDNGGPALTHALLPGSVAIDRIAPTMCVDAYGRPTTEDQRGVDRPQGDSCDIGAFELEQP